jgi:hypothetical protein
MSTPQDGPTRKKKKFRAARKLAEWRKQREPTQQPTRAPTPTTTTSK